MPDDCVSKIMQRCSVRKLGGPPIPEEDISLMLKCGFSAPTAGNRQPWRVVVVKDETTREKLSQAALGQTFVATAPVVFVVCNVPEESAERYGERGGSLYVFQDTAALTMNILLSAHLMGYGACWVGAFDEKIASEILNIPSNMRPVAIIPVGRIQGEYPPKRPRKSTSQVVIQEKF